MNVGKGVLVSDMFFLLLVGRVTVDMERNCHHCKIREGVHTLTTRSDRVGWLAGQQHGKVF